MSFLRLISPVEPDPQGSLCPPALYVSPEGALLVPGTPAFYDRIGYRNPDFDLGDYAVRNMGFVSIARISPERVRLRLRPDLVGGKTIERLRQYLGQGSAQQVEIECLDRNREPESWPNDSTLLQRLIELCASPVTQDNRHPYRVEPLELQAAAADYSHPLKPMFQKWRASLGQFNETTLPFLQRFGFFPKLVIIGVSKSGDDLRFLFQGSGIQIYDEDTIARLIGQPVSDQPDRRFGEWVNAKYKVFLQGRKPRLDSVEATIKHSQQEIRAIRYERLMLPWHSTNGSSVITVASVLISERRTKIANEGTQSTSLAASGSPHLLDRPTDEALNSR